MCGKYGMVVTMCLISKQERKEITREAEKSPKLARQIQRLNSRISVLLEKISMKDDIIAKNNQEWQVERNKDPRLRKKDSHYACMLEILDKLVHDEPKLYDVTGMHFDEFHYLVHLYEEVIHDNPDAWMYIDDVNSSGSGSRCKYAPQYELLIVLIYLKSGMQQSLLGGLIGWSQSTMSRHAKFVLDSLFTAIPCTPEKISKQMADATTISEFKEAIPGKKKAILIDGTAIQVPIPKDSCYKTADYSGKKKYHCKNVQVLATPGCTVLSIGIIRSGTTHDMSSIRADLNLDTDALKNNLKLQSEYNMQADYADMKSLKIIGRWLSLPNLTEEEKSVVYADKAYLRLLKELLGALVRIPYKRPRNGKLTKVQKTRNKRIGKVRIRIEHVMSRLKRWKRFKTPYMGSDKDLYVELQVAAGLVNMRIHWKMIKSQNREIFAEIKRKGRHKKV